MDRGNGLSIAPTLGYETFIQQVIRLHQQGGFCLTAFIQEWVEMHHRSKLAQIDQLKAWLDGFRPLESTILAELKQRYDVSFTYNSNAIEGNTLTQSETELVLSKGITIGGKTLTEHLEVIGHKEAIDYIESLAQGDTTITVWEIKQIHNLILRKISPEEAGCYRSLDVMAAGTNYRYPAHYLVPQLMTDFVDWLNSPTAQGLHPITYVTLAHYRFVSIYPFRDGNGRTGRLLMNLLLIRAGFPIVVIDNRVRNAYIDALAHGQQHGDDLGLLLGIVENAVLESLVEVLRLVATAASSRGRGDAFYGKMMQFLEQWGNEE
ncbi:MAG: hypothetical protein RLZZ435_3058 [Cyanobacteriota bacterium]